MFKIDDNKQREKLLENDAFTSDIFIQNQTSDNEKIVCIPPKFDLAWRIDYNSNEFTQSEWTPSTSPSITKTINARGDAKILTIIGKNIAGNFELDMVKIRYSLVKGFGYIGEQYSSKPGVEHIIGMWIELTQNRIIKVWRNGSVKETIK